MYDDGLNLCYLSEFFFQDVIRFGEEVSWNLSFIETYIFVEKFDDIGVEEGEDFFAN